MRTQGRGGGKRRGKEGDWSDSTGDKGQPGFSPRPGFGDTHGVLERQETVADPSAGGPVAADVGESLVQVAVGGTKGDLFDGLVYQQVLEGGRGNQERDLNYLSRTHSALRPPLPRPRPAWAGDPLKQQWALLTCTGLWA